MTNLIQPNMPASLTYTQSPEALQNAVAGAARGKFSIFPFGYIGEESPYNFQTIVGEREGVPFTEMWVFVNAYYDEKTQRFKRVNVDNFSFGWQWMGGGTYPGEASIGDTINQGMNLWKANGKKAYGVGDPSRDLTGEDIGALQGDGSWREFGIMLGWNNHFMLDAYGGMTIGGAGFEIDGSGTSPFKRVSVGLFSGGSSDPSRPIQDYKFAYNGECWNTQHGLWNKDEDQLAGYFYGMESPVNFYDQDENLNLGSNRADMNHCKFVFKHLGPYSRPYVENWQNILELDQDGVMNINSFPAEVTLTQHYNPAGGHTIFVPFPDGTWDKTNLVVSDLVGTMITPGGTSTDVMLRDRTHTWEAGGLRVDVRESYYTDIKITINRVKKHTMQLDPKSGILVGGVPINDNTVVIDASMIASTTDFNADFPDASWNQNNTMAVGIIGVLPDGNRRQLSTNITFTPYGMYGGLGTNEYVSAKVILKKY
jgi:hypothetical protein